MAGDAAPRLGVLEPDKVVEGSARAQSTAKTRQLERMAIYLEPLNKMKQSIITDAACMYSL
jgi:hypothetical protein